MCEDFVECNLIFSYSFAYCLLSFATVIMLPIKLCYIKLPYVIVADKIMICVSDSVSSFFCVYVYVCVCCLCDSVTVVSSRRESRWTGYNLKYEGFMLTVSELHMVVRHHQGNLT